MQQLVKWGLRGTFLKNAKKFFFGESASKLHKTVAESTFPKKYKKRQNRRFSRFLRILYFFELLAKSIAKATLNQDKIKSQKAGLAKKWDVFKKKLIIWKCDKKELKGLALKAKSNKRLKSFFLQTRKEGFNLLTLVLKSSRL